MPDPLAAIPLSSLRVFEAAARRLSFTLAAAELGISQAAVSWQVKALERRLDQPLFRRLPRTVELTPAGERLARAVGEAMTLLRSALADLTAAGDGVLAITTVHTIATQWLAPRLGSFQLAQPKIAVRLETDARVVDLGREGFDVALRSGAGTWPSLESVRLFPSLVTVLCTPEVAASLDRARGPRALLAAPRIGLASEWAMWFTAAGVDAPENDAEAPPRFAADAQIMEVAAAYGGQGAVLASPIMFAPDVAAGRLVRPFDVTLDLKRGVWLVYPVERRRVRKIVAFREWLLAQVADDPAIAPWRAA
ncbi:LysR substrate-binding domain-containing protein [Phenylobacterium sp.]|jgi:LysR family glycine cleavage system transcriptional activator|uniref:LysR substrate-binding domain-containing protein n=1 Tax=Phenylobacterium sp. TaxID=1871053 RepID=UPI002E323264|nr:LysR substrate-binding domain-containing protein [Phenylobacterium sp.]HEX4709257.1 LysR substrate-binding domain-containing protein [Phenylobacterium sp.]